MVETTYFQLTNEELDINFKCYALAYENKSLGVNGYYEFGIYHAEYKAYFLNKYGCEVRDADCPEFMEDLFYAFADKIESTFDITIDSVKDKYYWDFYEVPNMITWFVPDEYDSEEEE